MVKPDIDSNHEFTAPLAMSINAASVVKGPTKTPPSQYGNRPINTTIGYIKATAANASRSLRRSGVSLRVPNFSIKIPISGDNKMGMRNALKAISKSSSQIVIRLHINSGMLIAISVQPKIRLNTSNRILTP